jgi:hypothetical protein
LPISLDEAIVTLTGATQLLPARRRGKKVHVSCLYRWATTGIRGVRLETLQVGGTLCTSKQALERFFARLARRDPTGTETTPEIPAHRQREIERAARQAEAALK